MEDGQGQEEAERREGNTRGSPGGGAERGGIMEGGQGQEASITSLTHTHTHTHTQEGGRGGGGNEGGQGQEEAAGG